MPTCPAFDPVGPYVSNLLGFIDCHSLALAQQGYLALAQSSMFGATLSSLLAIFVALIGYRVMLMGYVTIRDAVTWVARAGLVLALALSWSAYQPLVYNLVIAGPQDLASAVLSPGGLGGADPMGLAVRVDSVDAALAHVLHPERDPETVSMPPPAGDQANPPKPAPAVDLSVADRKEITSASNGLTVTAIAGGAAIRVLVAALLALGPLFVASLLFDISRGLFIGWARTLAAALTGAIIVPAVIALELAVIEPQVISLVSLFDANQPLGALPERIWATSAVFALIMLAGLGGAVFAGAALVRAAISLPPRFLSDGTRSFAVAGSTPGSSATAPAISPRPSPAQRDRVQVIADAARSMEQRDTHKDFFARQHHVGATRGSAPENHVQSLPTVPLGRTGPRERIRRSAAAGRRDRKQ